MPIKPSAMLLFFVPRSRRKLRAAVTLTCSESHYKSPPKSPRQMSFAYIVQLGTSYYYCAGPEVLPFETASIKYYIYPG